MSVRIGLVGDYNRKVAAHQAIPKSVAIASASLGFASCELEWLETESLHSKFGQRFSAFNALWCVPATPYANMEGALNAIRFARENQVPFLGTCGGFQHALIERARNVLGLSSADHEETNPESNSPIISKLSCPLVEKEGKILLQAESRLRDIYGVSEVAEKYHCNFGLNPENEPKSKNGNLKFSGRDQEGNVRAFELGDHPFFFGTLYQPERSSLIGRVHPLIRAFVEAAAGEKS